MTSPYQALIDRRLPMRILECEWTDPTLTFVGIDWTLSITCPWSVERSGVTEFEWTSADVEDRVWDFIGCEIQRVQLDEGGDPHLCLSDGSILHVLSDITSDTWVLRLPELTLVGPLLGDSSPT